MEVKNNLTVFLYHPTVEYQGVIYVKPNHGQFIDEIASVFKVVYLVAPYLTEKMFPGWMIVDDEIFYNYKLKSNNIKLIKGISSRKLYPFRYFQQLYYSLRSKHTLFFGPSIGSIYIAPILWLFNKQYFFYLGSNIFSYPYFPLWNKLNSLLLLIEKKIISHSSIILSRGNTTNMFPPNKVIHINSFLLFEVNTLLSHDRPVKERYNILYVGTINPNKRVLESIKIIKYLLTLSPNYNLDIIGTFNIEHSSYYDEILSYIRLNNLNDHIRFHGKVVSPEKLAVFYKNASFLLLLSVSEGFPKVIHEAMIFDVIPVVFYLENYKNLLVDNVNCYFIYKDIVKESLKIIHESDEESLKYIRDNNRLYLKSMLAIKPSVQFIDHFKQIIK